MNKQILCHCYSNSAIHVIYHNSMKAFISLLLVSYRWAAFLSDADCLHLERLCSIDWLVLVTIILIISSSTKTDQAWRGSIFSRYSSFTPAGFFIMFCGPCQTLCRGCSVLQVIEFVTTFSFFSKTTSTFSFSTLDMSISL